MAKNDFMGASLIKVRGRDIRSRSAEEQFVGTLREAESYGAKGTNKQKVEKYRKFSEEWNDTWFKNRGLLFPSDADKGSKAFEEGRFDDPLAKPFVDLYTKHMGHKPSFQDPKTPEWDTERDEENNTKREKNPDYLDPKAYKSSSKGGQMNLLKKRPPTRSV
jgi:hypothetical protein